MITRRPRVLVTDAGRGSALALIRGFGRLGWDVVAAASERHAPGLRSRHVTRRVVHPPPEANPQRFATLLLAAVRRLGVDLLVPVTDAVIMPVLACEDAFRSATAVALPGAAAVEATRDKAATLAVARRLGVPVPTSALVRTTAEALAAADLLGWPLVVKPSVSRLVGRDGRIESFAVSYAAGPASLRSEMVRLEGRASVLLQRYCPGTGVGVGILADGGTIVDAFQHRRIHEVPVTGGASALRRGEPLDPVLLRHAAAILGELGWTGLAMVEFKDGPDGPVLMEVNGRPWGSLPLAAASGVDFAAGLARIFAPQHAARLGTAGAAALGAYRPSVRGRDLGLEIAWIGSVLRPGRRHPFLPHPPRSAALGGLVGLFDPRVASDTWSLDDPAPGLADLARVARHVARKVRADAS